MAAAVEWSYRSLTDGEKLPENPTTPDQLQPEPLDPPQAATPASTDPELMEMTVTARTKTPGDPLERANALSFEVTQAVDRAVVGPAALTFAKIVPLPVREAPAAAAKPKR